MSASSTDFFTKVGSPGTATTLDAPGHTIGGTSITVISTSNWPTGTGVVFAMDATTIVDGTETRTVGTYTEWEGVVASATSITSMVLRYGTDQNYAAGTSSRVYIPVAGQQNDRMVDGLVVSHNQDGTMITSLPLTTPKITTSINDSAGNEVIKTPATSSAVNEITVTNAATGNAPSISATGGDSAVHLNLRGKGLAKTVTIGAGATTIYPFDYVASGCVWTADAAGSTRLASMTAGVVVINGNPITVAAVTGRTFTASKDVYVDVLDNGDGTGLLVYTDGTTNAASGALAANSLRLAIIVVGATNIATAASINQGQEDRVLPIASSIPYSVTDSLGNLICNRNPQQTLLGYSQKITNQGSITTIADITGVVINVIVPTARKVKFTYGSSLVNNTINMATQLAVYEGAVNIQTRTLQHGAANASTDVDWSFQTTVAAGAHTYKLRAIAPLGNTSTVQGSATSPTFLKLELA